MLENTANSHASGARFIGQHIAPENDYAPTTFITECNMANPVTFPICRTILLNTHPQINNTTKSMINSVGVYLLNNLWGMCMIANMPAVRSSAGTRLKKAENLDSKKPRKIISSLNPTPSWASSWNKVGAESQIFIDTCLKNTHAKALATRPPSTDGSKFSLKTPIVFRLCLRMTNVITKGTRMRALAKSCSNAAGKLYPPPVSSAVAFRGPKGQKMNITNATKHKYGMNDTKISLLGKLMLTGSGFNFMVFSRMKNVKSAAVNVAIIGMY